MTSVGEMGKFGARAAETKLRGSFLAGPEHLAVPQRKARPAVCVGEMF